MIQRPRVGHIDFINCLPLSYAWNCDAYADGLEIVRATPAELNQAVVEERLEASPVSSIIYARKSENLLLLPDVSISAAGALKSILLVAKRPIDELCQSRIALTAKSATSHCLLKIILHQAYRATPDYFISAQGLAEGVLDTAEAVLLIGDDALHAYYHRSAELYYYDIGAEWKKLTGLMMVYAVWVVNRDFALAQPEMIRRIAKCIHGGFAYGLQNLSAAAASLQGQKDFSIEQIVEYIGLLNYKLTDEHQAALLTYYQMANELNLIDRVPKIQFAQV
ncbi:menaquinone biosynthesis protein [Azotosporobacter soli]|uniref:menaquinone biosynthetic enzyme MqnA/MqnD family protein n=1 Tax=Azotosporobacter soli TaxID=3055040 RepID=UPI0031FF06E0